MPNALNFIFSSGLANPLADMPADRRFFVAPAVFVLTLAQPVTGALLHFEVDAQGACLADPSRRFDAGLIASRMADDELAICEGGECIGEWLAKVAAHLGPVAAGAAFLS